MVHALAITAPTVPEALALALVSLAGLFAAARAAVWTWAVYQRRRADHEATEAGVVTPRQLRRASDRKLRDLERGLLAVTADVARLNVKVTGLEGDASHLKGKMVEAGNELRDLKMAQREDRDETQELRRELAEFTGKYEADTGWIKQALMRLENRRP